MSRQSTIILALITLMCAATLTAAGLPDYTPDANTDRSEVPDVYKWNLAPLYKSTEAWEKEMTELADDLDQLMAFQGKLENPKSMQQCLDLYFGLHDRASHLTQHANLALDSNLSDEQLGARQQLSLRMAIV